MASLSDTNLIRRSTVTVDVATDISASSLHDLTTDKFNKTTTPEELINNINNTTTKNQNLKVSRFSDYPHGQWDGNNYNIATTSTSISATRMNPQPSGSNLSNNSRSNSRTNLSNAYPDNPTNKGEGTSSSSRKKKSNTTLASGGGHGQGRSQSETTMSNSNVHNQSRSYTFALTTLSGLFKLLKDLAAFLIRGGLSTMMFLMDQALTVSLIFVNMLPGGFYVDATARTVMWLFQMAIWVVYTAIELNFYLPWQMLALYIPLLMVAYLWMPEFMHTAMSTMFQLVHWFLHLLKSYIYYAPLAA